MINIDGSHESWLIYSDYLEDQDDPLCHQIRQELEDEINNWTSESRYLYRGSFVGGVIVGSVGGIGGVSVGDGVGTGVVGVGDSSGGNRAGYCVGGGRINIAGGVVGGGM
jgi:hypothetical protein